MYLNYDVGDIWGQAFYDGEAGSGTNNDPPKVDPPTNPPPRQYTQDEVTKLIETERKRAQETSRATLAELTKLRETAQLTEQERSNLSAKIEELNSSLMTKEELAKQKLEELNNKAKNDLENATKESGKWKNLFEKTLIDQALLDAAIKESAYDPGVFGKLLGSAVSIVGDDSGNYKVLVKIDTINKDGKPVQLTLPPDEAIKHLKAQEKFGYLFKGTNTPGSGGNNNPGSALSNLDLSKMSLADYKKHRQALLEQG